MSKEKLFDYYLEKNPSLVRQLIDGRVVMSSTGFKKFFDTTYDVAYKQGFNQEPASSEDERQHQSDRDPQALKEILKLFGMH